MAVSTKHKVVIIGCGNLAWHLAAEFTRLNFDVEVVNHRPNKELDKFRKKFKCKIYHALSLIPTNAAFYFICVRDETISSVSKRIKSSNPNAVVLHCSGSMPLASLAGNSSHKGVFYPVQTFSKEYSINWKEVPILIETTTASTSKVVTDLAKLFSNKVEKTSGEFRLKVHLAAVLVNNFSNALYAAAAHLLIQKGEAAKVDLLLPLIRQTVKKLDVMTPIKAQTGPAKRGDQVVLRKHIRLLKGEPELQKIYKALSALILKQQQDA